VYLVGERTLSSSPVRRWWGEIGTPPDRPERMAHTSASTGTSYKLSRVSTSKYRYKHVLALG
jgi:hypothetical protein